MAVAEHLIAHTRGGARSLLEHTKASWLWARLRAGFPDALSCALMPDHVHLVAPPGGQTRFVRVLPMFSARFGVRFDVIVEIANTADIAARMIRYGFHNPVRDALVADPYECGGARFAISSAQPIRSGRRPTVSPMRCDCDPNACSGWSRTTPICARAGPSSPPRSR